MLNITTNQVTTKQHCLNGNLPSIFNYFKNLNFRELVFWQDSINTENLFRTLTFHMVNEVLINSNSILLPLLST